MNDEVDWGACFLQVAFHLLAACIATDLHIELHDLEAWSGDEGGAAVCNRLRFVVVLKCSWGLLEPLTKGLFLLFGHLHAIDVATKIFLPVLHARTPHGIIIEVELPVGPFREGIVLDGAIVPVHAACVHTVRAAEEEVSMLVRVTARLEIESELLLLWAWERPVFVYQVVHRRFKVVHSNGVPRKSENPIKISLFEYVPWLLGSLSKLLGMDLDASKSKDITAHKPGAFARSILNCICHPFAL
mmetsp:Transcript_32171/g.44981  ORF Transcript_32171/g.44981 Transcript_32171/m.44981 type:complete len:244 (+) Transcript_32171:229-960(+)